MASLYRALFPMPPRVVDEMEFWECAAVLGVDEGSVGGSDRLQLIGNVPELDNDAVREVFGD